MVESGGSPPATRASRTSLKFSWPVPHWTSLMVMLGLAWVKFSPMVPKPSQKTPEPPGVQKLTSVESWARPGRRGCRHTRPGPPRRRRRRPS